MELNQLFSSEVTSVMEPPQSENKRSDNSQHKELTTLKKVESEAEAFLKNEAEKILGLRDRINNAIDNSFQTEEATEDQSTPSWIDPDNEKNLVTYTKEDLKNDLMSHVKEDVEYEQKHLVSRSTKELIANLKRIERSPSFILNIEKPMYDEFELAFDIQPELAEKFADLPEKVQEFLVLKNPENIQYINNPHTCVQRYIILNYRELEKMIKQFTVGNYFLANPVLL